MLLTRAGLKWSMKALHCGIVTIMTDGCFQRTFYTFYPFQFFFIVQILYAKYCPRLGVYKLPLGFVGHRLSGEPPQHGHCSITLVLDNKRVYIAVFQRGGGEGKPKEE